MAKTKKDELAAFKLPAKESPPKGTPTPPFKFLNPIGGEIYEVGSNIAIYWTGGPGLPQKVNIVLIDVEAWTVILYIVANYVNTASPGLVQWTVPLTWLQTHNHAKYQFYIEDVPRTTWTYGPIFKIT